MPRVDIQHQGRQHDIRVLPEYLRINYTYQYVMQLDSELSEQQAKQVLDALKNTYDHVKGINEAIILNLARGVKGGIL